MRKTVVSSFGLWATLCCVLGHRGDHHHNEGVIGWCTHCGRSWWR
ncbi:MAG TPA: hypothetical protein VIJ94_11420 [Caulobacteraceae bacterium]